MRKITASDFILATEMQLIYDYIQGFEPIKGDLSKWKGRVGTISGTSIPIYAEVVIPPEFPYSPPKITITPKINHPNVDDEGNISLNIIDNWEPKYHVYQVIQDLIRLFRHVPAKPYKTKLRQTHVLPTQPISVTPLSEFHTLEPTDVRTINTHNQLEVEQRTLQEEIMEYQRKIEELNKKIEQERSDLLKKQGVKDQISEEITISHRDELEAELYAINDLLELLTDKFDYGDIAVIDYIKLKRKYVGNKYRVEKMLNYSMDKKSGVIMSEKDKQLLDLQAELFAAIVTLDTLSENYENGELESVAYKKQLRALIRTIFKLRLRLEETGAFKLEDFIEREKIAERYPRGLRHLRIAEGTEEAEAIALPFESLKKMPAKTADFVASVIEIIDLTRLRSVARADLLLNDLDELLTILSHFPSIPKDYWVIEDIKNWRKILEKYKPQEVIKEDECEKLEFQASRWLNDFRRHLKEL
ncbi:hypothetical protein J7L49_06990 [Candidatus Bathyarchaeota archaeon]|nr:hypothetical protein [Candidatus Bathyarchaeota archaeon]